jgi:Domain of unknown function (DUF4912)/Tetratricopeptide repeat
MTRAELERLDRDTLITRAEEAGVTRARILTRPELVDELLLRATVDPALKQSARGFFGIARDLLARVVERGLNLPDAADRIRTLGGTPPSRRSAPAALPTLTLAEIYAAQGHRKRAIETLEGVLAREPDHAAARALLAQLRDEEYPMPPPPLPPEEEEPPPPLRDPIHDPALNGTNGVAAAEPSHMLDDAPLPPYYDVDECVAIPVDPHTLYVYWEARESTLTTLRSAYPSGALALRLVVVVPTWDGPQSSVRDHGVSAKLGDFFARDLPPGSIVRVALGWKSGDAFLPIAHSPALETPPDSPSPLLAEVLVRWTPEESVPVGATDADVIPIGRAVSRVQRDETRARVSVQLSQEPLGSSAEWMHVDRRAGP